MALIDLHLSPNLDIRLDHTEGWLDVNWKGYQTVDFVKQGCERMLDLLVEHRLRQVLNDNTHVLGTWSGAAEWGAVDWFPRMMRAGLESFAWVYDPGQFSLVSIDTTLSIMDRDEIGLRETVGVKVFYDIGKARDWLRRSR